MACDPYVVRQVVIDERTTQSQTKASAHKVESDPFGSAYNGFHVCAGNMFWIRRTGDFRLATVSPKRRAYLVIYFLLIRCVLN